MATGFCVSSLLCQVLKNEVWKMRKKMPGRFTGLCPFFKFDPSLCPFHHTILSFATSREKLSPIGNEKEGKVTANVFWARWQVWCVFKPSTLSIRAFERVSVLYVFVCVSQHLRVEMLDFIFLQGHDRRKSCNWLELPVLDINTVMQAGLSPSVLEKQPALSLYFSSQPPWWPIIMTTQSFKKADSQ